MDPSIFYVRVAGKVRPVRGQKLRPENGCWDVTAGADAQSSEGLPLVFLSGYKVTYAPGALAVPVITPFPLYGFDPPRTWSQWWQGAPEPVPPGPNQIGIAVMYSGNLATFRRLTLASTTFFPVGAVSSFIPAGFKPDGRNYRQLTPDGELK